MSSFPGATTTAEGPARHSRVVELVERMLELHKKLPKAKGEAKTSLERAIAATDKQIDELVYALYGLTDKEIAIVEGGDA